MTCKRPISRRRQSAAQQTPDLSCWHGTWAVFWQHAAAAAQCKSIHPLHRLQGKITLCRNGQRCCMPAPGSTRQAPTSGAAKTRPQLFAWNMGTTASTRLLLPSAAASTPVIINAGGAQRRHISMVVEQVIHTCPDASTASPVKRDSLPSRHHTQMCLYMHATAWLEARSVSLAKSKMLKVHALQCIMSANHISARTKLS